MGAGGVVGQLRREVSCHDNLAVKSLNPRIGAAVEVGEGVREDVGRLIMKYLNSSLKSQRPQVHAIDFSLMSGRYGSIIGKYF